MQKVEYWIRAVITAIVGAVVAVLTAAVKHLWGRQKQQAARQDAVEQGLQALLHDRIFAMYAECHAKGYAAVEDMRNAEYLYKPYHNLGGNSTGTELYQRIKNMPTEPPKAG
jgi:hypothetical protein